MRVIGPKRLAAASLAGLVLSSMFGQASYAADSIGVGIQAQPVMLLAPCLPGHTYSFPSVYVVNKSENGEVANLNSESLNKGSRLIAPAAWFHFPAKMVLLTAKGSAHIPITLQVPKSAHPGRYQSDVVIHAYSAGTSSAVGAQVSAAAATKIDFTVVSKLPPGKSAFKKWELPGGIALLVVLLIFLIWKSGLRITTKKS
ncbi:MAG TPA: hypothetical protein VHV57_15115 [Acidimicrobiales bacterium]|nr:hypothetical protein [Acidimicrobiales bacterium]